MAGAITGSGRRCLSIPCRQPAAPKGERQAWLPQCLATRICNRRGKGPREALLRLPLSRSRQGLFRRLLSQLPVLLGLPLLAGCTPLFTAFTLANQPGLLARLPIARRLGIGCPRLVELDGSQPPQELYRGMAACLRRADRKTALTLFTLAAAYGRFDAERVADPSARQAATVLRLVALQRLSASQREALSEDLRATLADPLRLPDLCARVERIGPPRYQPRYLTRHGLVALGRSLGDDARLRRQDPDALVPDFNAASAWNRVLDQFLRCGKA